MVCFLSQTLSTLQIYTLKLSWYFAIGLMVRTVFLTVKLAVINLLSIQGKHTIFGRVESGMQIVKRMGNVATNANNRCGLPSCLSYDIRQMLTKQSTPSSSFFPFIRPLEPVKINKAVAFEDDPMAT